SNPCPIGQEFECSSTDAKMGTCIDHLSPNVTKPPLAGTIRLVFDKILDAGDLQTPLADAGPSDLVFASGILVLDGPGGPVPASLRYDPSGSLSTSDYF